MAFYITNSCGMHPRMQYSHYSTQTFAGNWCQTPDPTFPKNRIKQFRGPSAHTRDQSLSIPEQNPITAAARSTPSGLNLSMPLPDSVQLPKELEFVSFSRPYKAPPPAPDSERTPEVIEAEMKALEAAMEALALVTLKWVKSRRLPPRVTPISYRITPAEI